MPNVIESLINLAKSFMDEEPKPPLHVGEVMNCWTYLTVLDETIALEQISLNTTTDPELRDYLEKTMAGASSQARRLTDFLQREGVPLPPASEPKPLSDPSAVPPGAKLTDDQIANLGAAKLAMVIIACATNTAQAVRSDVGVMFTQFQAEAMTYGSIIKTLMKKRGWLKVPPAYLPTGSPNHE